MILPLGLDVLVCLRNGRLALSGCLQRVSKGTAVHGHPSLTSEHGVRRVGGFDRGRFDCWGEDAEDILRR